MASSRLREQLEPSEPRRPLKDLQGHRFVLRALGTEMVGENEVGIVINRPFDVRELGKYLKGVNPTLLEEHENEDDQEDPLIFVKFRFRTPELKQQGIALIKNLEDDQRLVDEGTQLLDVRVPVARSHQRVYHDLKTYGPLLWLRFWKMRTPERDAHLDPLYLAFAKYRHPTSALIARERMEKEYGARLGKPRQWKCDLRELREPFPIIHCEYCNVQVSRLDIKDHRQLHTQERIWDEKKEEPDERRNNDCAATLRLEKELQRLSLKDEKPPKEDPPCKKRKEADQKPRVFRPWE